MEQLRRWNHSTGFLKLDFHEFADIRLQSYHHRSLGRHLLHYRMNYFQTEENFIDIITQGLLLIEISFSVILKFLRILEGKVDLQQTILLFFLLSIIQLLKGYFQV